MELALPCPLDAGWELVRTVVLPKRGADGSPLGGFSAAAYQPELDRLWLLSDAPRGHLIPWSGLSQLLNGQSTTLHPGPRLLLRDGSGHPLPEGFDGEGLVLVDNSAWIASEIPTHHFNQMKLFNAIAAAAVISTCFVTAAPAEAGNGWIHAGTSVKGDSIYVRPLSRNGSFVNYEETLSGNKIRFVANCPALQYKSLNGNLWRDVMPNSIGASAHRTVCSVNIPKFAPRTRASNISYASCNEKVDAVFYSQ